MLYGARDCIRSSSTKVTNLFHVEIKLKHGGLIRLLFLIGHLYLYGMLLGMDLIRI